MSKKNKNCEFCHHPVSGGGDRHRKGGCPTPAQHGRNRATRKRVEREKRKKNEVGVDAPRRAGPVAGTGKPKGTGDK